MFIADLIRFGIIFSKFSCRWLDGRTAHLSSMNRIPFWWIESENARFFPLYASERCWNKRPAGQVRTLLGAHSLLNLIRIDKRSHEDKKKKYWFEVQIKINFDLVSCYWITTLSYDLIGYRWELQHYLL